MVHALKMAALLLFVHLLLNQWLLQLHPTHLSLFVPCRSWTVLVLRLEWLHLLVC